MIVFETDAQPPAAGIIVILFCGRARIKEYYGIYFGREGWGGNEKVHKSSFNYGLSLVIDLLIWIYMFGIGYGQPYALCNPRKRC